MNAAAVAQLKTELLKNPRRLDARAAAIRLIGKRDNLTPAVATRRLEEIRETFALNDLFRSVMPNEYQAELKKANGSRLQIGTKFFSSLGFPVYEDAVMEWLAGRTYYGSIPIEGLAYHACGECFDFQELPTHYQLAHVIARSTECVFEIGSDELREFQEREDRHWKLFATKYQLPARLQPRGAVDFDILFRLFAAQKGPVRFVLDVLRAVSYQTGSIFMDFDEEMGAPDIEWSARNVDGLRIEYQLAVEVKKNIDTLGKWLHQKPAPRIKQALRLYAQTRKLTDEQRQRVRVAPDQGNALVRIL